MLWKVAFRNLKRHMLVYSMSLLLIIIMLVAVIFGVTAFEIKNSKFSKVSKYIKQEGMFIKSLSMEMEIGEFGRILLRVEDEIKEKYDIVEDVLSVADVWDTYIDEKDMPITTWCYGEEVTKMLSPSMQSGRWFNEADNSDEILKAVVTYNEDDIKVGDVYTISNDYDSDTFQVEIIGVLKDDESLFYSDYMGDDYSDYRDMFYTYDYKTQDGEPLLIISDGQIVAGQDRGLHKELNPYFKIQGGFQRQMFGGTIITYKDNADKEQIAELEEEIRQSNGVLRVNQLSDVYKNSVSYILNDVKRFIPVMIAIFVFMLVTVISAHVVSTKKNIRDYAIYNICGLNWHQCSMISLYTSIILVVVADIMVGLSICIIKLLGVIDAVTEVNITYMLLSIFIVTIVFTITSWIVPYVMMKKNTAVKILKKEE